MITFGDDAFDSLVNIASNIPAGYAVELIPDDPEGFPSAGGRTVEFVKADHDGVHYRAWDEDRGEGKGPVRIERWESVGRIHVY